MTDPNHPTPAGPSPPPPDPRLLSGKDLLALWHANRNSSLGLVAAEECARRFERLTQATEKDDDAR
jgi:hypothetical protein